MEISVMVQELDKGLTIISALLGDARQLAHSPIDRTPVITIGLQKQALQNAIHWGIVRANHKLFF